MKFRREDIEAGAVFGGTAGCTREVLQVADNAVKFKVLTATTFSGKLQPGFVGELSVKEFARWARKRI